MESPLTTDPTDSSPATPRTAIRTSRAIQLRAVADWQASGQSQAAFARSRGIPAHRLRYWVTQAKRRAKPDLPEVTDDGFDEYPVPAVAGASDVRHVLHLRSATGVTVELSLASTVSAAFVAAIVQDIVR